VFLWNFIQTRQSSHALTANLTRINRDRLHCGNALKTNRKPGNIHQRGAAKTAIGGKKRSEKALGNRCRSRNRRVQQVSPWLRGRASYVSGTAEDQPPSPGAWLGSSRTNSFQYSGESGPAQLLRPLRAQAAAGRFTFGFSNRSRRFMNIETLLLRKQFAQRAGCNSNKGRMYFSRKVRRRERYPSEPPQSEH